MTAIEFLKSKDPNFSLLTDTNQSYSLQGWIDLMEDYSITKNESIIGAKVNAFMPSLNDRYRELETRHNELTEMCKTIIVSLERLYNATEYYSPKTTAYKLAQNHAENVLIKLGRIKNQNK